MINSSADFFELQLDQLGLFAFAVVPLEGCHSFFMTVVRDKPARRLRKEPDSRELDQTGQKLEKRGKSPGPCAVDLASSEGNPRRCNASDEPAARQTICQ